MTGPAEGKLKLRGEVYLSFDGEKVRLKDTSIYIHLKGYAMARVTHLDIEHGVLDNIIPPRRGEFLNIVGVRGGIEIRLEERKAIDFRGRRVAPSKIEVAAPLLNVILDVGERTRTWVGGKLGGIYVGFKKQEVEKLEEIARSYFGVEPLARGENERSWK